MQDKLSIHPLREADAPRRVSRHDLPVPLTALIGREQEVAAVCEIPKTNADPSASVMRDSGHMAFSVSALFPTALPFLPTPTRAIAGCPPLSGEGPGSRKQWLGFQQG